MPYVPINIVLDKQLPVNGDLSIPYPAEKNAGHFFSAINHTMSVDGSFFRCPRDFVVNALADRISLTWRGEYPLQQGSLLNVQLDAPGGDFYHDPVTGITVANTVESNLFLINLASPLPASNDYFFKLTSVTETKPLSLAQTHIASPRNVVIHSNGNNSHCTFHVEGEDFYDRGMIENIQGPESGSREGNKAFKRIARITPSHPCNGEISIGMGNKFGLPVFLPAPGFLMREIINGIHMTGGTITPGETDIPGPTTGDRRGTYTPPKEVSLDGVISIHLLASLPNPGNIGMPDYGG